MFSSGKLVIDLCTQLSLRAKMGQSTPYITTCSSLVVFCLPLWWMNLSNSSLSGGLGQDNIPPLRVKRRKTLIKNLYPLGYFPLPKHQSLTSLRLTSWGILNVWSDSQINQMYHLLQFSLNLRCTSSLPRTEMSYPYRTYLNKSTYQPTSSWNRPKWKWLTWCQMFCR